MGIERISGAEWCNNEGFCGGSGDSVSSIDTGLCLPSIDMGVLDGVDMEIRLSTPFRRAMFSISSLLSHIRPSRSSMDNFLATIYLSTVLTDTFSIALALFRSILYILLHSRQCRHYCLLHVYTTLRANAIGSMDYYNEAD